MKAKRAITVVLSVLLLAFAVYVFSATLVAKKNNRPTEIFGISLHIVVTDSMTPEINPGDYLIAKKVSVDKVAVGDDVVFRSSDPALNGKIIVHRVIKKESVDGKTVLTTQGIKDGATPDTPITEIFGVKLMKSAFLGHLYLMFTSPFGILITVVVIVCIAVAARQVKKIIKTVKEKDTVGENGISEAEPGDEKTDGKE